jgi:tRNA threonylcarbamoyl adenosine modification protein (Sua5/YciO/YrdC/YwlC family)
VLQALIVLLDINVDHPEPRKIQRAVDVLENGGLIAYPTDTVYGLGCDLLNKNAIERLYQVKGMQKNKNLAFICHDLSDISKYAVVDNTVYRMLRHYLPGPYCFILQATREVPKMVLTKQKTVGIRVPNHPVIIALTQALGRPIISTTAARPGEPAMVDPTEIRDEFKGLDLVLDGGAGGVLPTTVVDLSEGVVDIVREGAGSLEGLIEAPAASRRGR